MIRAVIVAFFGAAALAAPAFANPTEAGRWSASVTAGADFPVGGDVHGGARAPIADLGPLNPSLAGVSAVLQIGARSFDDIYGEATLLGLELAYGLGGDREVFGALRRLQSDSASVQVGGALVPALSQTLPVIGTFGEYKVTTAEVGVRQYFGGTGLRPYVAGRLGLAATDEIRASFAIPAANILIANVPFYDETTRLSVGGDVGLSYAIADRFTITAEVGLRYTGGLEDNDSAIGGLGLAAINNEGDRVSVPVSVRGVLAF